MKNNTPPIFIGGSGRSGTTLLVDMLGGHRNLSPIYETEFIIKIVSLLHCSSNKEFEAQKVEYYKYVDQWSNSLPKRPHNKNPYEKYVHGPHYINFSKKEMMDVTEEFLNDLNMVNVNGKVPDYINKLFFLHAKKDDKLFWINKTPNYVQHLEQLLAWFPNMKFIHIIRDGRDVALSVRDRIGPKNFVDLADWWMQQVLLGMNFGEKYPDKYIEVKYEDLILAPSTTLSNIFSQLGYNVDESAVEEIIKNSYDLNEEMIFKWKNHSHQIDLFEFTKRSNTLLKYLGYDRF